MVINRSLIIRCELVQFGCQIQGSPTCLTKADSVRVKGLGFLHMVSEFSGVTFPTRKRSSFE